MTTKQAPKLKCPDCGNENMFNVYVEEVTWYQWTPSSNFYEWENKGGAPTGKSYHVECAECDCDMGEHDPWD